MLCITGKVFQSKNPIVVTLGMLMNFFSTDNILGCIFLLRYRIYRCMILIYKTCAVNLFSPNIRLHNYKPHLSCSQTFQTPIKHCLIKVVCNMMVIQRHNYARNTYMQYRSLFQTNEFLRIFFVAISRVLEEHSVFVLS